MKLSAYHIEDNRIRTTRILGVKDESQTVKTFTFKDRLCAKAKPGQFLMLWILGIDEIPLSVLDTGENGMVSVAVKKVGEATEALHNKKVGDVIGVRGPFGNSYTLKEGKILMVGGGTGLVPLLFLAKKSASKAAKLVFLMGAKSRDELLFMDELRQTLVKEKTSLVATTEDGSYGIKGMATAPLEALLTKERFDMIYTCGPEKMIRKVFDTAEKHGVHLEASLERLMRCAIGLCGSCVMGKYRVCRDGPVFTATQLRKVKSEFGISTRDFHGIKVPLE